MDLSCQKHLKSKKKQLKYMNKKEFDLSQRVGSGEPIELNLYLSGLLDVVEYLCIDLEDLLAQENRKFGIVKSYINSIRGAFKKANEDVCEEDLEVYGKILYLYKPLLKKNFTRLVSRGLSPADADICIIRKILLILEETESFSKLREAMTVKKVITKLYDNIRNRAKEDSLYIMANTIRTYMDKGLIGKHNLDTFSIIDTETPQPKSELQGSNTRLSLGNVVEIDM